MVGSGNAFKYVSEGPASHAGLFIAVTAFSGVFYFIFGWLREQACTLICPYGRLQSVFLDSKSIVVAYDYKRGEPRARFVKNENRNESGKGHCVDCRSCVAVCPTGIDIRNGTQLECVNCAACIDACDKVMERFKMPKGLIRYASESEIEKGEKFRFTGRMLAYTVVLAILIAIFAALVFLRGNIEATVLRAPGLLYQPVGQDSLSNLYNIKVINKTFSAYPLVIKLTEPDGQVKLIGKPLFIEKGDRTEGVFFVVCPKKPLSR
ncbi:MAG: 4Fe-4S dicluster domain-containing protein, partial [Bacteroidales bacterium]|nr:4Fe-4S dicluster domain-containing protein [Bacteroidales bacterium]